MLATLFFFLILHSRICKMVLAGIKMKAEAMVQSVSFSIVT